MKAKHFELLVEEPSMEAFLHQVLPRMAGSEATYTVHVHRGKPDLLAKLGSRLRAYAKWLPGDSRIVVLIDRDGDDCSLLKQRLEREAREAGLATRAVAGPENWRVLNRIAVEELEAWFFGEWAATQTAFPGLKA